MGDVNTPQQMFMTAGDQVIMTLEDEDEFLFYNNGSSRQNRSFVSKLCQCLLMQNAFGSPISSKDIDESTPAMKPCGMFGEKTYSQVCEELRQKSCYKGVPGQGYISLIVKSGDDLRQEQFASQLISKFKDIFDSHKLKLWLKPFNIIATCNDGGLIQTIPDAISIDKLKKTFPHLPDLRAYFITTYRGVPGVGGTSGGNNVSNRKRRFHEARTAFV